VAAWGAAGLNPWPSTSKAATDGGSGLGGAVAQTPALKKHGDIPRRRFVTAQCELRY
jgi:hypothetical protein